jgi:hypothetical protein
MWGGWVEWRCQLDRRVGGVLVACREVGLVVNTEILSERPSVKKKGEKENYNVRGRLINPLKM